MIKTYTTNRFITSFHIKGQPMMLNTETLET